MPLASAVVKREFQNSEKLDRANSVQLNKSNIIKHDKNSIKLEKPKNHHCDFCGKSFYVINDLKKHVRTHTGERPYECTDCGAKFSQCGGLKNHVLSRHCTKLDDTSSSFSCYHCEKSFPIKERLRLHLRTHTGERPYKCKHCSKTFARGGQLAQHLRTHSGAKPYSCAHCKSSFTCSTNLKIHLKRHLGERDHICDICGKGFLRRDGLQKHLVCYHAGVRAFHCSVCNKDLKGHFLQHLRTHVKDKPHACSECDSRFAQRSQLTVHMRIHSGEKPYTCQICKCSFAHSTALRMHVRRHTGEKPFKCLLCSTSFVQLPHLKKHMLCIHKTNKPYLCLSCRKFFKTKNELISHQLNSSSCERNTNGKESDNGSGDASDSAFVKTGTNGKIKKSPMSIEKMRMLLAVLLKKISTPSRLDALGFGRRLIDEVLCDSIESSGRKPCYRKDLSEGELLKRNVKILLKWTIPKEFMDKFRREKRSTEELLEELSS